jgi:hypothetical protein
MVVSEGVPSITPFSRAVKRLVEHLHDDCGGGAVLARRGRVGYCNAPSKMQADIERRT